MGACGQSQADIGRADVNEYKSHANEESGAIYEFTSRIAGVAKQRSNPNFHRKEEAPDGG